MKIKKHVILRWLLMKLIDHSSSCWLNFIDGNSNHDSDVNSQKKWTCSAGLTSRSCTRKTHVPYTYSVSVGFEAAFVWVCARDAIQQTSDCFSWSLCCHVSGHCDDLKQQQQNTYEPSIWGCLCYISIYISYLQPASSKNGDGLLIIIGCTISQFPAMFIGKITVPRRR